MTTPPARPSPSAAPPAASAAPGAVLPVDGTDTEPMLGAPPVGPHHAPLLSLHDRDDDALPGSTVGEYVLEERIGEGGFGAVYRAQHPMIGKLAAVKVLSAAFSSNAELSKRFVNEARVVNRINHRNIVDIFSFGHLPDGRQYFVMEYLDGQSLGAYLAHRQKLPVGEALPIFRAVASAVDAAHAAGIVHRDLKPDNVFLARDGQGNTIVKLLDFGIAKIEQGPGVSNQTRPGQVLGTPSYMSPEQARGAKVDGRSDVYSFAALIHRTLTGRSLFFGLGAVDVALAHINEPPPLLSSAAKDLPPGLDAPLQRALSKKPADRPATLGEVVTELTAAATEAGIDVPDELAPLRGIAPRAAKTSLPAAPLTRASTPSPAPKHDPNADTIIAGAAGGAATVVDVPKAVETPTTHSRFGTSVPLTPRTAGAHGLDQDVDTIPGERSSKTVLLIVTAVTIALAVIVTVGLRRGADDEATEAAAPSSIFTAAPLASEPTPLVPLRPPLPAPPPASVVQITVQAKPTNAEIFQGEAPLGAAGTAFPLPRGSSSVTLTVRAPGFAPGEVQVLPDRPREVEISLKRPASTATGTAGTTTAGLPSASPSPAATTTATAPRPRTWDVPADLEPPP